MELRSQAPFDVGPDSLFVAYYASAEFGCFLALDWPFPSSVLDLYPEFRLHTCGHTVTCGHGLLGALAYFGQDGIATVEKIARSAYVWKQDALLARPAHLLCL